MKRAGILCAVAALSASAGRAFAAASSPKPNDDILSVNNSVTIGYAASDMYYIEPSGVNQINLNSNGVFGSGYEDYESGTIPGVKLAVAYMDPDISDLYLQVNYQYVSGDVTYTGFTQGPPVLPINGATSRATIQDWGLRAGKGIATGDKWMVTPYATFGGRHWVRELGPGSAFDYDESYNHYFLGLGSLVQFDALPAWVLTADASVAQMIAPTINDPADGLDNTALGPSPILNLGFDSDYRFNEVAHIFAGINYQYFTYGQSANQVVPGGWVMEPFSRTEVWTYSFGARLSFR